MDDRVVLVRGVPGSGKTTFAKTRFGKTHHILEADDYFMVGGEYVFDKSKLREAHNWCKWRFDQCVTAGRPVVVANTFTRVWEMEYYLKASGRPSVYVTTGKFDNVHGVPSGTVAKMRERFEPFYGEILVEPLLEVDD